MMSRENSEQQWFECTACGAAMDGDEMDAAQQVPAASGTIQADTTLAEVCGRLCIR
jgi:hypothetical protein